MARPEAAAEYEHNGGCANEGELQSAEHDWQSHVGSSGVLFLKAITFGAMFEQLHVTVSSDFMAITTSGQRNHRRDFGLEFLFGVPELYLFYV